jgi:hypothetical protein
VFKAIIDSQNGLKSKNAGDQVIISNYGSYSNFEKLHTRKMNPEDADDGKD